MQKKGKYVLFCCSTALHDTMSIGIFVTEKPFLERETQEQLEEINLSKCFFPLTSPFPEKAENCDEGVEFHPGYTDFAVGMPLSN